MKKVLYIFLPILLLGCSTTKKLGLNKEQYNQLNIFLTKFEEAVIQHNKTKVIACMDKDYVYEQHDIFLNGKTHQFLNEFFCGYTIENKKFKCLEFETITTVKRKVIATENNNLQVYYKITSNNFTINTNWMVKVVKEANVVHYSLVGAVG